MSPSPNPEPNKLASKKTNPTPQSQSRFLKYLFSFSVHNFKQRQRTVPTSIAV
jgi:hypothetical protein